MLDIGWPELFVIAVVALLVIGPRDLPRALYTVGKWVRKVRRMTSDFQRHIDDMVRETELEDVRKSVRQIQPANLKRHIENAVDPGGEVTRALGPNLGPKPIAGPKPAKPAVTAAPADEAALDAADAAAVPANVPSGPPGDTAKAPRPAAENVA